MQIIVHRGTHQIGGCATEIRTDNTHILIDFGTALPDGRGHTPDDALEIDGLNIGKPNFDGVFLTHYHADHLGLISQIHAEIPVYMGRDALDIFSVYADRVNSGLNKATEHIRAIEALHPLKVGDLTVTSLRIIRPMARSCIWWMRGKTDPTYRRFPAPRVSEQGTPKLLARYAADVDVLMIEGTQLSRRGPSILLFN